MDDNVFKQFLTINKLKIAKTSVTCMKCKNWLAAPIYVMNTATYCGQCRPTEGERSRALEDIFNNYKYPCRNSKCKTLLDYKEVAQHATICKNVVVCTFCQAECDKTKLIEHLTVEHNVQVIDTDKPKFTITLNMPLTNMNMHLVEMYSTQFLLIVSQENELIKCSLMKLSNGIIGLDKYDVRMTTNLDNTMKCEGVLQHFDSLLSDVNQIELHLGKAESCSLEVSIAFGTPECPVCYNIIASELQQCIIGHNVCGDCGSKINSCPLCRQMMVDQVFNMRNL